MKKKWIWGITAVVVLAGAGGIGYWKWQAPYQLPKLDSSITMKQLNLDFTEESKSYNEKVDLANVRTQFPVPIQASKDQADLEYQYGLSLLNSKKQTLGDAYLEAAVKSDPQNLVYSSALRKSMTAAGKKDQLLEFFHTVEAGHDRIQLQEALMYADDLQNPELGTASLGQKSMQSISYLNQILAKNPYDFLAHYARGLNNLYWPLGLRKVDNAVQDLSFCVAVAKQFQDQPFAYWPLAYEAYGDALVKKGDTKTGIAVWKDGLSHCPNFQPLKQRVEEADQGKAYDLVKQERGIDSFQRPNPDITDLSIIWQMNSTGDKTGTAK